MTAGAPGVIGGRFNGAALRRARIFCDDSFDHEFGTASTGPRSGERGYVDRGVLPGPPNNASTGPRSGERGYHAAALADAEQLCFNGAALRRARIWRRQLHGRVRRERASTGPRSGERGYMSGLAHESPSALLQRGRAPESADITVR